MDGCGAACRPRFFFPADQRRAEGDRGRVARLRSILLLTVILALMPAHARADGPLRAVIRIDGAANQELWSRIAGQTVDLDAELIAVHGAVEAGLDAELDAACALADEHDARVVVWFRQLPGQSLIVYVAEPRADTVFVRSMGNDGERGPAVRSATLEAAALVVRSALRALAAGGTIGITTAQVRAEEEPPLLRWHMGVGAQVVGDGASQGGHYGLAARVGASRGQLRVHAELSSYPAITSSDALTSISVARHGAGLAAGYVTSADARRGPVLAIELGAGALLYQRSTVAFSPDVVPREPASSYAVVISPGARMLLPLGRRGHMLEAVLAADVVLGAPHFGYQENDRFVLRNALWPLQPRLGIGLVLQSF